MTRPHSFVRLVRRLPLLAAMAWCVACVLLYVLQRELLYWPQNASLSGQRLSLRASEGPVLVSVQPGVDDRAVIYLGGNAEDVSQTAPLLAAQLPGRPLYLLHYRAYGGSAGSPNEAALVDDARQLFDLLAPKYRQIDVIGRSLGSGVAIQLAASRPIGRLVLITPYDSMLHVAQAHYPWLPVGWLLKDTYDSLTFAAQVRAPSLLLIAGRDQVIPAGSGESLAKQLAGDVTLQTIGEAGHDDIVAEPAYLAALQAFMTEIQPIQALHSDVVEKSHAQ